MRFWIFGIIFLIAVVSAISRWQTPHTTRKVAAKGPPGWEDLLLCSLLTSIDSTKALTLDEDMSAELTDNNGGSETKVSKGQWSVVNAERHMYRIDTRGAEGTYTVVSPPDAEGCVLAAGASNYVDLRRSWFSVKTDYPDPP
jgi:hypothetical protein